MNAMPQPLSVSSMDLGKAFTYRRRLSGATLTRGLEPDLKATKPGIYLTSDDGPTPWTRYVAIDYYHPPKVAENGLICNASVSEKGYLTTPNPLTPDCLLLVKIFDPVIRQLKEGALELSTVSGEPRRREMVWKKNLKNGQTVGIEAFYLLSHGDVIAIVYPGGIDFIGCQRGEVKLLSNDSAIVKAWLDARHEAEIADDVDRAIARAMEFPEKADWQTEIVSYAKHDIAVKEAFLETLYGNIAGCLNNAGVDEEGKWMGIHMFMLHTLAEVVKYLPEDRLQDARRLLRGMEQKANAELPMTITAKFGYERQREPDVPVLKSSGADAKRRRHEQNLERRAEENRARAKGGTGHKKTEQSNGRKKK